MSNVNHTQLLKISFASYNSVNIKMSKLSQVRQKISKEIRQKNREQIRSELRKSIFNSLSTVELPFISSTFKCFWECSHWDLLQSRQKLIEVIEQTRLSELNDEDHNELVGDLFYLLHELSIKLPCNMQFKKNGDGYTASLIAFISSDYDERQLAYWVQYMSDEDKQLMFLSISAEDYSHNKWVENKKLFQFMLEQTKWSCQAATTFKQILVNSQVLSKKDVDESIAYIYQSISINRKSEDMSFRRTLFEIWITFIQMYAKLKGSADKVNEMIMLLKKQIALDVRLLLSPAIIQDLNELYDAIMQDYIQPNNGCNILLRQFIETITKNEDSNSNEDMQLFRLYLFRLCYNNWRAKQLSDRKYFYTPEVYTLIEQINNGRTDNPYFGKLMGLSCGSP